MARVVDQLERYDDMVQFLTDITLNALRVKDFPEEAPSEYAPADWRFKLIK